MSLNDQLTAELARLKGFASANPQTSAVVAPGGERLEFDWTAVDTIACAVREIRAIVPQLASAPFAKIEQWGRELCRRITYLLEDIGPIELDPAAGEVLIRSLKPQQVGADRRYFEVLLHARAAGEFGLRRYSNDGANPGRVPVDFHLTHEILFRLAGDIVDTIPAVP